MAEPQIDPSLLSEGTSTAATGRGAKRKTRTSETSASAAPGARVSTRLAGKSSATMGVGVGIGVGKGGKTKGKGKEQAGASEVVDGEPARGEEENLIGSEYKLRGVGPGPSTLRWGRETETASRREAEAVAVGRLRNHL